MKEADSPILRVPISRRELLRLGVATGALGPAALLEACSSDDEKQPTPPDKSGFGELLKELNSETDDAQLETEHGLRPFLHLPFQSDPDMAIQTAFTPNHHGIDFISGQADNSATWRPFTIIAPADAEYQSNPGDREGNAFFARKKIADEYTYFYGGHLSTLNPSLPEAKTGQWIELKAGTILGTAGDTGVEKGLVHLHFSVGRLVNQNGRLEYVTFNPYGLGEDTPRGDYPDPMWSNGKMCGPDSLWLDCSQVQSVRTTIPQESETPGPVETAQPTEVATEAPTEEPTQEPTSVERPAVMEELMQLDNWEVGIVGWKEKASSKEGWKTVVVEGNARNIGNTVLSGRELRSDYFQIFSEYGDYYPGDVAQAGLIPPGFSIPFEVTSDVPISAENYKVVGVTGSINTEIVRGQTYSGDLPVFSEGFPVSEASQSVEIDTGLPGSTAHFKVTFKGIELADSPEGSLQYASFEFENLSGYDADISQMYLFSDDDNIQGLTIFLPNGERAGTYLGDYVGGFNSLYGEKIPPKLAKQADFQFGGGNKPIYVVRNAYVSLVFNSNAWITWKVGENISDNLPTPIEAETAKPEDLITQLDSDYLKKDLQKVKMGDPQKVGESKDYHLELYYLGEGKIDMGSQKGYITFEYEVAQGDPDIKDGTLEFASIRCEPQVYTDANGYVYGQNVVEIAGQFFDLPEEYKNSYAWNFFGYSSGYVYSMAQNQADGSKLEFAIFVYQSQSEGDLYEVSVTKILPHTQAFDAGTHYYTVPN